LRASSVWRLGVTVAIALWSGATVSAHRLDEYLQAARIDLQRDGITIDLDLTPGADVAESILATIDGNQDGLISVDEQNAYAADVVRSLQLTVDGAALPLRVTSSVFPAIEMFRRGEGTVRVQLRASHPSLAAGNHQLFFSNGHLARHSVYLVNALMPAHAQIAVAEQRRDVNQRTLTIDYSVGIAAASLGSSSLLAGLAALVLAVRYARRHGDRP
jgi:hypothetical protein